MIAASTGEVQMKSLFDLRVRPKMVMSFQAVARGLGRLQVNNPCSAGYIQTRRAV